MARISDPIEVRIRDIGKTRLFVHELEALRDEMRIAASPFAERFERAIERFVDGGDDESGGEHAGTLTFDVVSEVVTETVEPCSKCGHIAEGGI